MSDSNLENGAKIAGAIPETLKIVDNICEKVGIYDLMKVIYGNRVHYLSEKQQLRFGNQLKNFKQELENSTSNIQEENLQEPKMSIVGPALEASKYYFDEKEIREMFANLIASSMDSTYNGLVQHSFVEIIKQLSPYDAKLFASFNMVEPIITFEEGNGKGLFTETGVEDELGSINDFCYKNNKYSNFQLNEIAINNLMRLGLLKIQNKVVIDNGHSSKRLYNDDYERYTIPKIFDDSPELEESTLKITSFGLAFKDVCIKDSL